MLTSDLRTVVRNDSAKFSCASRLKGINFDSDFMESRPETSGNVEGVTRANSACQGGSRGSKGLEAGADLVLAQGLVGKVEIPGGGQVTPILIIWCCSRGSSS